MTTVQRETINKESCTTSDVARIGIGSWVGVDGKQSESSSLVWTAAAYVSARPPHHS